MILALDEAKLSESLSELASRDADLGAVVAQFGAPGLRTRPEGFATLILLILEQQVSLSSAQATFARLKALCGEPTPRAILAHSDDDLRTAGLSRQKARYCRALAETVASGILKLDGLDRHADDAVREALVQVPGIGPWTADIYLLAALRRPDVFPARDLALQIAAQDVKKLPSRPGETELCEIGESWRPWRAVAARILWHHYLHTRRRQGEAT